MNKVLKSVLIFLAAVLILVAGTFLPGLLLDRVMEGKLYSTNYIDIDAFLSYEEDFYDSKQRLTEIRDSLITAELNGGYQIIDYDECNYSLQKQYNGGYAALLQFVREWDDAIFKDFYEWHIVSRSVSISNDGYLVGIISFNDKGKARNGNIVFDLESGIPLSVSLELGDGVTDLEDIWRSYLKVFGQYTNMSFNEEDVKEEAMQPVVDGIYGQDQVEYELYCYAANIDGSLSLSCTIHGTSLQISLN